MLYHIILNYLKYMFNGCKGTNKRAKYQTCLDISERTNETSAEDARILRLVRKKTTPALAPAQQPKVVILSGQPPFCRLSDICPSAIQPFRLPTSAPDDPSGHRCHSEPLWRQWTAHGPDCHPVCCNMNHCRHHNRPWNGCDGEPDAHHCQDFGAMFLCRH